MRDYLAAVLPGLANVSIQRLPELTPYAWASRQQQSTVKGVLRLTLTGASSAIWPGPGSRATPLYKQSGSIA